ncbi:MAG TPA: iron-containing alcohol dehydrogenase, partial [Clostridiaceae bacterium]|nr:iron-containing alcohol dehydrogenase [Clostridiaceae bacterium]
GISEGTAEEKALAAIEALKCFFQEIGAPVSLKERNITSEHLEEMAANAVLQGSLGSLKKLEKADVLEILKLAL